jgi:hypothetical protein
VTPEGDKTRRLGVIECFAAVVNQCPSGAARQLAERALATVQREGAKALPEQAFLVRSGVGGWQGERATQVKRSLDAFLAEATPASR